ncbi:MAG: type II toxin-antitoxin system VapC family toxin [Solirubrobacteraceae bacterium]|jgi:toxin-antitoxin system PIN domain toxin
MLLVDANVLLHAVNERAREHQAAHEWLLAALDGPETIGLAWIALLAFLRLATHPAVFPRPLSTQAAADIAETWLAAPHTIAVEPTPRHLTLLRGLLVASGTAGNLVNDAHLAALALEHDATVVSFDRDFARFAGVRSQLPLA